MNTMGIQTRSVDGILPMNGVSEYQESTPTSGIHVMTEHLGPNAIARPTSHDHKQADKTKNIFIFI